MQGTWIDRSDPNGKLRPLSEYDNKFPEPSNEPTTTFNPIETILKAARELQNKSPN